MVVIATSEPIGVETGVLPRLSRHAGGVFPGTADNNAALVPAVGLDPG
jgi:hypothetical protein